MPNFPKETGKTHPNYFITANNLHPNTPNPISKDLQHSKLDTLSNFNSLSYLVLLKFNMMIFLGWSCTVVEHSIHQHRCADLRGERSSWAAKAKKKIGLDAWSFLSQLCSPILCRADRIEINTKGTRPNHGKLPLELLHPFWNNAHTVGMARPNKISSAPSWRAAGLGAGHPQWNWWYSIFLRIFHGNLWEIGHWTSMKIFRTISDSFE